eukprot:TRINITY_DN15052_c0_g1_i1.p1 TRINITY_DN15052_c0_g1~~TRINITY_DN15052_c0_g1_i1.p1  ORF type:complete len:354 (+),score=55.70 TRINITY_DN15052_c0_g1_i1:107-1063(+)
MSNRAGHGDRPKRRHAQEDRCMDEVRDRGVQESVLMDGSHLVGALQSVTKGGKKRVDGLYLPGGRKVEDTGEDVRGQSGGDAGAQDALNLQRVVRIRNAHETNRRKKAHASKKSEEELHDEESAKKAKAILDKATEHDLIQYNELFNFFDVDKDRTWGTIEFAQRMTDIGAATSVEDASNLLYFAGVRDVDRITYDDFVQLMPKLKAFRIMIEKDAMRAFQRHDPGVGWVTRKAVKQVFEDILGPDADKEQVNYLAKKADRLKDGMITYDFFIRAMFDDTAPCTTYVLPRKRSILARMFCCSGGFDNNHHDDHHHSAV